MDDVFTRPYIAYFDSGGTAHNFFVLPQEDPVVYENLQANFNRSELVKAKVELSPFRIRDKILDIPEK